MDRVQMMQIHFGLLGIALLLHTVHAQSFANQDEECIEEDFFSITYCRDVPHTYFCPLNQTAQSWFRELYTKTINDSGNSHRVRREIRTLSAHERHVLFRAINALKSDKSIEPNKYDVFAGAHYNRTICSAHVGSNFLGWHRVYLLLLEAALREKESSVVLPYWGSSIDSNPTTDAETANICRDELIGNGEGNVTTGPFKGWKDAYGCQLERNLAGNNTRLLSAEIVDLIENDDDLIDVANITDSDIDGANRTLTIEGQHNLVHNWIGGHMQGLDTAPRDPVFFMHHAYIDYIWERFREKQKRHGIDPAKNYPGLGAENYTLPRFHAGNRTMDCFNWITNEEGYSNIFTASVYKYADLPRCPNCGSEFLTCDTEIGRCIPLQNEKEEVENVVSLESLNTSSQASMLCMSLVNVVLFLVIKAVMSI